MTRTPRMIAIEKEYGRSIREVIFDFRRDLIWKDVAACLSVSRQTLLVWRKMLGLPVSRLSRMCYLPELTPMNKTAQELGFENMEEAVFKLLHQQGKDVGEACQILGCCEDTLYRYYPDGKEYFENV